MLVDLKPEELFNYKGSSPCPKDIDKYWDESLEEMRAVDRNIELTRVYDLPNLECFDLYFTGVNNARIYAKYVRPKHIEGKAPAVLIFHGYSGSSPDWSAMFSYAALGFCVAALDCRGQAGKSEDVGGVIGNTLNGHIIRGVLNDDPKKLLFRDVFLDTAELADIVINFDEVDEKRVYAQGGSQGGGLTLACASLEPRIAKASPSFPFLSDYKRVWDMDLDVDAFLEIKEYFRKFDPNHEREEEFFTKLGYVDIQNIVKRIKAKVFMHTGLMDTVVPPSTQFAAYNKITSEKKVLFYHDFGHEYLPACDTKTMLWFLED